MKFQNFFKFRETGGDQKAFLDHIEDLRLVLMRMAIALGAAMILSFVFRTELAAIIQRPLIAVDPSRAANLQSLGVPDSMMISLEISLYAGLIISFPFLLFFLGQFVLPGLTPKERKMMLPGATAGFGLFLGGVLFAYFWVLPMTLEFFFEDAKSMNWQPMWTVREYYSFTTQFIIAFGLAFELPVAILLLVKLELLTVQQLRQGRSFALVIIFVLAAIITPTQDIFTLLLMGGPMYLLYEICILLAAIMERKIAKNNNSDKLV